MLFPIKLLCKIQEDYDYSSTSDDDDYGDLMDFGLSDYIGDEDYGNAESNITIDELGKLLEDFSAEEPVRYLNRNIFSIIAYVTS